MIARKILHYQIEAELGQGGMGVVYRAHDTKLERPVAIKFLPHDFAKNREQRERFLIEAKAAAALNHANIATIHAIEEAGDELFIVMEYIDGQELKAMVRAQDDSALPLDIIHQFALQIAAGLEAAHKRGIVHRDVKSSNIMITAEGQVKIMDFGLAKVLGDSQITRVGTILGTAAYMSPEQAIGEETDQRTDIWSLGVVLYEMLTGRLPFQGANDQVIIYAILNNEPKPPLSMRADIPAGLESVVYKALTKDPAERYTEMHQLLADLRSPSERTTVSTSPVTIRSKTKISIAVLPFTNMSDSSEQDYFCDGMADEIINALSRVENLHVAARTSSFYFRGQNIDISEIGRKLKVAHILEGSVRQSGKRLRINAQLIKVADGYHLWSERFDRTMEDVFAIQDEISLAIVDKLKVRLLAGEKSALVRHYTDNVEAYNLYLKGIFYLQLLDSKGYLQATHCFEQVLELDPDYALAYVGLGSIAIFRTFFENLSAQKGMLQAEIYARKALEIDHNLGEALALLGRIQSQYHWDWTSAQKTFQKAIDLNPNHALTYAWYAVSLASVGRHEEAVTMAKRAADLDPLSSYVKTVLAERLVMRRHFDEAIEYAKEALTLNPNNFMAYHELGFAYEGKSMLKDAVAAHWKSVDLAGENVTLEIAFYCSLCFYHKIDQDRAAELFDRLKTKSKREYVPPTHLYLIYLARGEFNQAYEWLSRAVAEHDPVLAYFNEFPMEWARIPNERRFKEQVRKIGLMPKEAV